MSNAECVRNPIDSAETEVLCLAWCVLLEAWHALAQQIRVITKPSCMIGSTGQMGPSGILCRLEMI